MVRLSKQRIHRRGSMFIEVGVALPLILIITFGSLEYAWAFMKKAEISAAARAGVRAASLENTSLAGVQAVITEQMNAAIQRQSQGLAGLAAGSVQTAPQAFLQNLESSAFHLVATEGRTACGWRFARSRTSTSTRSTLSGVPGILMCELCLPSERLIACTLGPAPLSDDD